MTIRDVPIEKLSVQDLKEQIERGMRELRVVDYKAKLPGNSDGEKKEFLKDVCSFANAGGGDLIYGMIEVEGVPTELCGADLGSPDAEVLRLENVIRDGLDPRLVGFSSQPVELEDGHCALVIRIPRSVRRLHAVSYKGHWRSYSRNSAGKYPMDVSEVRDAFAFSESLATRMRDFKTERLSDVISGQSPIAMQGAATTVLHIMPLSAFDAPGQRLDLTPSFRGANRLNPIQLGGQPSYNFDGVLSSGRRGDWLLLLCLVHRRRDDREIERSEVTSLLTEAIRMRRVPSMVFVEEIGTRGTALAGTGLEVWEILATPIGR